MTAFAKFLKLFSALLFTVFLHSAVQAQTIPGISSTPSSQTQELPDPLTPESVREMVSKLSDSQVRDLLLQRLDAVAKEEALKSGKEQSGFSIFLNAFKGVNSNVAKAFGTLPETFGGLKQGWLIFMGDRGIGGLLKFIAIVAISIGLGFLANWVVDWLTRSMRERILALKPEGLRDSIRALLSRFGIDLIKVAAFAVVSLTATGYLHASKTDSDFAGLFITTIFILILLFLAMGRVIFTPNRPDLRLMPIDDESAQRFQKQMGWLAVLGGVGPYLVTSLELYGFPIGAVKIGFWTITILHLAVITMIYFSRSGIRQAIRAMMI